MDFPSSEQEKRLYSKSIIQKYKNLIDFDEHTVSNDNILRISTNFTENNLNKNDVQVSKPKKKNQKLVRDTKRQTQKQKFLAKYKQKLSLKLSKNKGSTLTLSPKNNQCKTVKLSLAQENQRDSTEKSEKENANLEITSNSNNTEQLVPKSTNKLTLKRAYRGQSCLEENQLNIDQNRGIGGEFVENSHDKSIDRALTNKHNNITKRRKLALKLLPEKTSTKTMSVYDYSNHQSAQSNSSGGGGGGGVGSGGGSGADYLTSKSLHTNSNSDNGMHSVDTRHFMNSLATTMAKLSNIGNSCYLNSVVYTLRFAPLFLHNLHHLVEDLLQINQKICQNKAKSSSLGRNISGLQGQGTRSWSNKDLASVGNIDGSPKTPRQIVTEKLHELYNNLHRHEMIETIELKEGFPADTFLNAVQDVSSIFGDNQQQDAHEFLMCILDSIRETCQSLTKAINDCPDILLNGCASLPEKTEKPQSPTIPKPIVKSLPFFRKRNKDDKQKNNRINSPLKDSDSIDSITASKPIVATTTKNSCDQDLNDSHDNKKNQTNEKMKKLDLDFFTEDFEGITVSSTKCLSCETVTEQEETMIDISVPITSYENNDRESCDHQFIQNLCITREHFRADNKYRCEVCIGLTEAIRTVKYKKLPRLLIIQLKRFSGGKNGMEKINSYIPTPFTMQCFCAQCCYLPDDEKLHIYKLYSVITHVGATLSAGHYIAYTCSLDGYSEYINCPKDRRKHQQQLSHQQSFTSGSSSSGSSSGSGEKNASIVKKMMFGRSKASSSGDVTKNINGSGFGKSSVNGIDKCSFNNTSCQGLNCCGIYMKNGLVSSQNNANTTNLTNGIMDYPSTTATSTTTRNNNLFSDHHHPHHHNPHHNHHILNDGYLQNNLRPFDSIWHMCDDHKITAMSQTEFKELLSPNSKKVMITPYLLFYARTDIQNVLTTKNCE